MKRSLGLILVRPTREPADVADRAASARKSAERLGLPLVKTFRARRGPVVGEAWHGPVQFLEPEDARELYRRLHRRHVLVLSFTSVFVRMNPRLHPLTRRAALELGKFVEHKAEFDLIRDAATANRVIGHFTAGKSRLSCTGEDDPRCLPLHVFRVDQDWAALSEQDGRDAFQARHGPARSRVDGDSKRWARADRGAYHGQERLTVAGVDLLAGMHWDVTSERGRAQLATADEIWTVPRGPRGYINVYPDAYVRQGARSTARRVWPPKRPAQRP